MTRHPKDRPPSGAGISRRQLLRRGAVAAVGLGTAGVLAGCENTTVPIGAACETPTGGNSSLAAELVVAKPLGPGGLPLPRTDNSVTWAITEQNSMIADGKKPEGGTLNVYNYADYIWPGLLKRFGKKYDCKVAVATYNSADEAFAKLASGQVTFDVIIGLTGSTIVQLMSKQLLQPLNHSYLPNLEKNIWPELQDPFYDRGSRYTVPYVVWSDGIGWRNDKIKQDIASMDVPWDIFWQAKPWTGKVGLLDDQRDALSMPIQRDAMRTGAVPDINTEEAALVNKAEADLEQLVDICNIKVAITDYQTLPEGKTWLHHSWSGDVVGGAIYYMPKGVPPTVLSYWGPETNGVVQNDFLCIQRGSSKPALAHTFLNYLLNEKNAYDNFYNFNGYVPPQVKIDAPSLVGKGVIPKTLEGAIVRPDQFAGNQELLSLSVQGQRVWDDAWSKFKAG